MRIALISDIHGNFIALEAVLADLNHDTVDQLVCLGDIAEGGPQPSQVVQRLRTLRCPVVLGNTDLQMLTRQPDPPHDADTPIMNAIALWCADQLLPEDLETIRSFPLTVECTLADELQLLGFHGSPHANTDWLVESTSEDTLASWFGGIQATVLVGGHNHTPMVRRYGDRWLVNPGSVGLPYERILPSGLRRRPPWAEYAVVSYTHGRLSIELRHIPIDVYAIVRAAYESGMPHADWWVPKWRTA